MCDESICMFKETHEAQKLWRIDRQRSVTQAADLSVWNYARFLSCSYICSRRSYRCTWLESLNIPRVWSFIRHYDRGRATFLAARRIRPAWQCDFVGLFTPRLCIIMPTEFSNVARLPFFVNLYAKIWIAFKESWQSCPTIIRFSSTICQDRWTTHEDIVDWTGEKRRDSISSSFHTQDISIIP